MPLLAPALARYVFAVASQCIMNTPALRFMAACCRLLSYSDSNSIFVPLATSSSLRLSLNSRQSLCASARVRPVLISTFSACANSSQFVASLMNVRYIVVLRCSELIFGVFEWHNIPKVNVVFFTSGIQRFYQCVSRVWFTTYCEDDSASD